MSGYKGHCAFNIFLALPVLLVSQFYLIHSKPVFLYAFIGTFIYTTLFMNPDLDLVHNIKLLSIRGLFSLPFRAYSKVFRHRGISHSPILGSLTRLAWLTGICLIVFFAVNQTLPTKASILYYWGQYKYYFIYGFAGIWLADLSHLLLDIKR